MTKRRLDASWALMLVSGILTAGIGATSSEAGPGGVGHRIETAEAQWREVSLRAQRTRFKSDAERRAAFDELLAAKRELRAAEDELRRQNVERAARRLASAERGIRAVAAALDRFSGEIRAPRQDDIVLARAREIFEEKLRRDPRVVTLETGPGATKSWLTTIKLQLWDEAMREARREVGKRHGQ